MDCHSRPAKKSTSHGIELLMQDTAHLIQRPCYQRGIHAKIQQAIGPQEDLTIIKRRKLKWYSHVSHSSGLAKAIFQGTVKGGRRQGRQKKRWVDNIREWTGLEITKSQRVGEKWIKLQSCEVVYDAPTTLVVKGHVKRG